jgi:5-methyltetrahydrofolate--homocysteine methyltransferase
MKETGKTLQELLAQRILVIDGAMGTMIQALRFDEKDFRGERFAEHPKALKGCNDLLCLTQPDAITKIHYQYLEAGADIIETNTFNSTSISMADYQLESAVYDINFSGARAAKNAVERFMANAPTRPRFVAGAMGPTNRTCSISTDVHSAATRGVTYDELARAYYEQARGLLDGGADILLVETIFDTLNSKAAFFAIATLLEERKIKVPLMASVTFIQPGSNRGVTGQTVEAFWNSISHVPLLSVGMNCALGPKEMRPLIEELAGIAPVYISTYPNAGLPDPLLPTGFPETPESLAPQLREWAENGWLNIVGGCCGTTPEHIAAIAGAVEGLPPRVPAAVEPYLRLSGLESVTVRPESNFINIGERTNVTGSPVFSKLILAGDYEKAVSVARQQVEGGAQSKPASNACKGKAS